jgi:hypothetical protein
MDLFGRGAREFREALASLVQHPDRILPLPGTEAGLRIVPQGHHINVHKIKINTYK